MLTAVSELRILNKSHSSDGLPCSSHVRSLFAGWITICDKKKNVFHFLLQVTWLDKRKKQQNNTSLSIRTRHNQTAVRALSRPSCAKHSMRITWINKTKSIFKAYWMTMPETKSFPIGIVTSVQIWRHVDHIREHGRISISIQGDDCRSSASIFHMYAYQKVSHCFLFDQFIKHPSIVTCTEGHIAWAEEHRRYALMNVSAVPLKCTSSSRQALRTSGSTRNFSRWYFRVAFNAS